MIYFRQKNTVYIPYAGQVAARVSELTGIDKPQICFPVKEQNRVIARSIFYYFAVRELGISISELSRMMNLSLSGVSLSVKRGEKIVDKTGVSLKSKYL